MSTTPPEQGQRPTYGYRTGDLARLPVPGNAEFVFLIVTLIVLGLVALVADRYDTPGWVHSLEWLGAAYLISRGIAKASRVLEQ